MKELTKPEREKAAAALEQVLDQVKSGDLIGTPGQAAYVAGVVVGLRARLDVTGQ